MISFCNVSLVDTDIIIELQPIDTLTCNQIYHTSQDLENTVNPSQISNCQC